MGKMQFTPRRHSKAKHQVAIKEKLEGEMILMRLQGHTVREIAAKFGMSQGGMSQKLAKLIQKYSESNFELHAQEIPYQLGVLEELIQSALVKFKETSDPRFLAEVRQMFSERRTLLGLKDEDVKQYVLNIFNQQNNLNQGVQNTIEMSTDEMGQMAEIMAQLGIGPTGKPNAMIESQSGGAHPAFEAPKERAIYARDEAEAERRERLGSYSHDPDGYSYTTQGGSSVYILPADKMPNLDEKHADKVQPFPIGRAT